MRNPAAVEITGPEPTVFSNAAGVYQDGVLAFDRDPAGLLWAVVGHENLGGMSVWAGPQISSAERLHYSRFSFDTGTAGPAFGGSRYPDGPRARGLLWPCGLYIDPSSGTFHLFVHNETAWGAGETAYTAREVGVEGEPDFRHIGKLTSHDQGRTWDFDGWIITSSLPSWTVHCRPDGLPGGQSGSVVSLGAGDFSVFASPHDDYLYIFYTQIFHRLDEGELIDRIYVARSPKRSCGAPGTWKKYFEQDFVTDGNGGPETQILTTANVPCVTWNTHLGCYLMTSYNRPAWTEGSGTLQFACSDDLVTWTSPVLVCPGRQELSLPYFTQMGADGAVGVTGREFLILAESNGTDVLQFSVCLPQDCEEASGVQADRAAHHRR